MTGQSIISDHKHNISTTVPSLIDWSTVGGVQKIYISSVSGGVAPQGFYIAFDSVANSDSFYIQSTVGTTPGLPATFEFTGTNVKTISILPTSATNDIYIMGVVT